MILTISSLIAVLQSPDAGVQLAQNASDLPLLSFIGFGVLVGGLISVLRTRRRSNE